MALTDNWLNGAQPAALPTDDELTEHGALVGFEIAACRFITEWLPLADAVAQDRPYVVTYADHGTVEQQVMQSLKGVGISFLVDLDTGVKKGAQRASVFMQPFGFYVSIVEHPVTNRGERGSGITCKRAAELVACAYQGWQIGNGQGDVTAITFDTDATGLQKARVNIATAYLIPPPTLST